ncbi:MAG: hypothetical protein E7665_05185 [Ruminococcaceae bacterium]|nr:hypothetical protein [Oscillospiraceae bacterium]
MKKAFFSFCLAFALVVSIVVYCTIDISSRNDKVVFTENVIKGNSNVAKGVKLDLSATYGNFLVWDSTVSFDNTITTESDYKFYPTGYKYISENNYTGVNLMNYIEYGDHWNEDSTTGINKAYKELYDSLKPGEEGTKEITLSDYYDYYPIHVEVLLPGLSFHHMAYRNIGSYPEWAGIITKLRDFFKIPVLPNEKLEISVSKPTESSYAQTIGLGSGSNSSEAFNLYTLSAVTDEACYLTFDPKTTYGNIIDTSLIPGGFGIYRIPYITDEKTGNVTSLTADDLSMVHSLDPSDEYIHFCASHDKSELMLYTSEKGKYYLTVFDLNMNILQKTELFKDHGTGAFVETKEDYVVFWGIDKEFTVLVKNDKGEYTVDMHTKLSEEDFYIDVNNKDTYIDIQMFDSIDYKNKRLAIARTLYDEKKWMSTCGFTLTVFDESGVAYRGDYTSSLDAGINASNYVDRCRILNTGENGITVNFSE